MNCCTASDGSKEPIVLKNSVCGPRGPNSENVFPLKPAFSNLVS